MANDVGVVASDSEQPKQKKRFNTAVAGRGRSRRRKSKIYRCPMDVNNPASDLLHGARGLLCRRSIAVEGLTQPR